MTKELIKAEIDKVDEGRLGELYDIVRSFTRSERPVRPGLLERLQEIEIDAPEDFATNFDLYVSGEKGAGSDLR